jgi:hypothetical protein
MTGTPSRTATAHDGGAIRRSVLEEGYAARVGGKEAAGKAPVRGTQTTYEAVEGGARAPYSPKPESHPDTHGCICGGYVERRLRVLPREFCLSVRPDGTGKEAVGIAVK